MHKCVKDDTLNDSGLLRSLDVSERNPVLYRVLGSIFYFVFFIAKVRRRFGKRVPLNVESVISVVS